MGYYCYFRGGVGDLLDLSIKKPVIINGRPSPHESRVCMCVCVCVLVLSVQQPNRSECLLLIKRALPPVADQGWSPTARAKKRFWFVRDCGLPLPYHRPQPRAQEAQCMSGANLRAPRGITYVGRIPALASGGHNVTTCISCLLLSTATFFQLPSGNSFLNRLHAYLHVVRRPQVYVQFLLLLLLPLSCSNLCVRSLAGPSRCISLA